MKPELKKMYDASLAEFGYLDDDRLMGLCILAEAGGEIREGRIAVGTVILERVDHRAWDGQTIKEVILWPCQFSWTLPRDREHEQMVKTAKDFDSYYTLSKPLCEKLSSIVT